jgi:hypothetical protein
MPIPIKLRTLLYMPNSKISRCLAITNVKTKLLALPTILSTRRNKEFVIIRKTLEFRFSNDSIIFNLISQRPGNAFSKDKDTLSIFSDFLAEHWISTSDPSTSSNRALQLYVCSLIRSKSPVSDVSWHSTLPWKEAQKIWKRIKGCKWIPQAVEGINSVDGELAEKQVAASLTIENKDVLKKMSETIIDNILEQARTIM